VSAFCLCCWYLVYIMSVLLHPHPWFGGRVSLHLPDVYCWFVCPGSCGWRGEPPRRLSLLSVLVYPRPWDCGGVSLHVPEICCCCCYGSSCAGSLCAEVCLPFLISSYVVFRLLVRLCRYYLRLRKSFELVFGIDWIRMDGITNDLDEPQNHY